MRLPRTAHTDQPWRIHELARDFRVEDVWSYRAPGSGPDDFPVMLAAMRAGGGLDKQALPARFLFAVRWKLGALLGWDKPKTGLGTRVRPLRDRVPRELAETVDLSLPAGSPFTPVYDLDNESVRELANRTVHGIMHLGWVRSGDPGGGDGEGDGDGNGDVGDYELRMAVLVKANGRYGRVYMALIAPFRYLIVYPALTRQWERAWRDREQLLA
ncbi:DUF2867 domain-containing protein (plasmid) [Embleya sp. NBC_00888]|uniref:DUF2867 domain-containing protein n=1 Tax=Embleya sp. NBC_00888 TaxID=2975960 RepID=UPI002F917C87|nr:DUF2867 domain-containing protein [Embleya sp. NBC_00888]